MPVRHSHQAFAGIMMVVFQAVLVPDHLAVELVHQFVHGSVQIFMGAFGKHVTAFDMDVALRSLSSFLFLLILNGQKYLDINYLVKMTGDSIELGRYIGAKGWGYFKVMTADRQVHEKPPAVLGFDDWPATPSRSTTSGSGATGNFTMRPGNGKCNPFFIGFSRKFTVPGHSVRFVSKGLAKCGNKPAQCTS
jgi:hypothetical protein